MKRGAGGSLYGHSSINWKKFQILFKSKKIQYSFIINNNNPIRDGNLVNFLGPVRWDLL